MRRGSLFFTREELAVVVAVGVVSGLAGQQIENVVFAVVARIHSLVIFNDFLAYYSGGPLFGDLLEDYLEWGAVLAACIVRKPGAGTIALSINGLLQVFVYGTHDPHLLYGVAGLGADLVFGAFRYRRYDVATVALAGAACQMFWYTIVWFTHGIYLYAAQFILADLAMRVLGGAMADGLLAGGLAFVLLRLAGRGWTQPPSEPSADLGALRRADGAGLLAASFGVLLVMATAAFRPLSGLFARIGPPIPPNDPFLEEFNLGSVFGFELIFLSLALLLLWHLAYRERDEPPPEAAP
ncbi:MAG: ECF transporter S component [Nitrososphaerota archaeon]|nr:ECF transporter S component [Nitrososphaerota archaeon]MDG6978805.1 ECF transporter S component [Nitrososphaerota archaeon]MDG7020714.1 ECF transporter S component [Nitrososphaerota archaeon]